MELVDLAKAPPRLKFLEILRGHVTRHKNRILYQWLNGAGNISVKLTYEAVWDHACEVGRFLESVGVQKGERVVLCYDFSLDFIQAFIGCMIVGAIPVPIYPPNPSRLKYSVQKMRYVVEDCGARLILTHRAFSSKLWKIRIAVGSAWPNVRCVDTDRPQGLESESRRLKKDLSLHPISSDTKAKDLAFLQYTSGSTSNPKGVMISYTNLMHNMNHYLAHFELSKFHHFGRKHNVKARPFCWLPQYHDLGLINNYLFVFYIGSTGSFMSPFEFVRSPSLWLVGMWKTNSNASCAPNFAFGLSVRKWKSSSVPKGFNLESIIGIPAGGEENHRLTIEKFERFFSKYGLRRNVVKCCYGLAEHVVSVSADPTRHHSKKDPRRLCCGDFSFSDNDVKCKIVDSDSCEEVADGMHGEIWVQSPSVALGYWNMPELSASTFGGNLVSSGEGLAADDLKISHSAKWLRTGDIGYMEEGKLYFVSRLKDLIVICGKNYAPKDFEEIADGIGGIRPGCTVAFSVKVLGTEGIVLVSEVRDKKHLKENKVSYENIAARIKAALATGPGMTLADLVLIKPRTILKTTSGKLRRAETKKMYLEGKLKVVYKEKKEEILKNSSASDAEKRMQEWEDISADDAEAKILVQDDATIDFSEVHCRTEMFTALRRALGRDWDMKESKLGSSLDSIRMAEMAGALRDSFGIIFDSDLSLLRLSAEQLLDFTDAHCEAQCKLQTTDDWLKATKPLPRDVGGHTYSDAEIENMLGCISKPSTRRNTATELPPIGKHHTMNLPALFKAQQSSFGSFSITYQPSGRQTAVGRDSAKNEANRNAVNKKEASIQERQIPFRIRGMARHLLQLLLSVSIFFIGAVSALPAYHYAKRINKFDEPWSEIKLDSVFEQASIVGILSVMVLPIWAMAFTVAMILMKWIICFRYRPGVIRLHTIAWYRWWYIDRMLLVWESIVGSILKDTVLLNIVYMLMGAQVSITATLNSFIREPDLVSIGPGSSISGCLQTHIVFPNSVALDRIIIGTNCSIQARAVVELGSSLGDSITVCPLTRIPESSMLASNTRWEGNPPKAMINDNTKIAGPPCDFTCAMLSFWILELLKVVTLFLLPILLSAISIPGVLLFWYLDLFGIRAKKKDGGIIDMKYFMLILYTFIIFSSLFMLSVFLIVAKWILAGHIREGIFQPNIFTKWRRWFLGLLMHIVDGYFFAIILGRQTPIYNIYSRLLGMKILGAVWISSRACVNPEDAHLVTIADRAIVSLADLVPQVTRRGRTAKARIYVGKYAAVGFFARVEGSVVIQDECMVGYMTCIDGSFPGDTKVIRKGSIIAGHKFRISKASGRNLSLLKAEVAERRSKLPFKLQFLFLDAILFLWRLGVRYLVVWVTFEIGIKISDAIQPNEDEGVILWGLYILILSSVLGIVAVIQKWLIVGRQKPSKSIGGSWESLRLLHSWGETITYVFRFLLPFLGSMWGNLYYNMLGAKIALDSTIFNKMGLDHDMITIGYCAAVNEGAEVHGHLYRDHCWFVRPVSVGPGAMLGPYCYLNEKDSVGSRGAFLSLSKHLRAVSTRDCEVWHGFPAKKLPQKAMGTSLTSGNVEIKIHKQKSPTYVTTYTAGMGLAEPQRDAKMAELATSQRTPPWSPQSSVVRVTPQ